MEGRMRNPGSFLGSGLRFPIRRVGSSFEETSGEDKVLSSIPYILLTNGDGPGAQGEQPWDTEFGSNLRRLKYSGLSGEALRQYVLTYVVEALARNEPRVQVWDLYVHKYKAEGGNQVDIEISVFVIKEDTDFNEVVNQPDAVVSLTLPY